MMNSANPELNTVFVVPPPRTVPSVPIPVTPYPDNQPPVHLHHGYQTQMISPYSEQYVAQKIWKESKVLGAIQIIIGLMHIGFGTILTPSVVRGYISFSFWGGYPYWGGISFLISGSLSVTSQKAPAYNCRTSGSVGMNIVSAIFSAMGIILFITELSLNSSHYLPYQNHAAGKGISSVLLLFSILELAITCVSSHSGCLLFCSQSRQVAEAAAVPPVPIVNPMIIPQFASEPPLYSAVVNGRP